MLKFKKTSSTPAGSPHGSPVASPRRPKLVTRIDSIGGPSEQKRVSLYSQEEGENACQRDEVLTEDKHETLAESTSSSEEEFEAPESKLRDVTKRKLNREKRNQVKQELKKEMNILTSKDFYNRQQELKIWIHETTGKDLSEMSEKKLKDFYKKFMEKWNKKKLHMKYYRGVDLHSSPLPAPEKGVRARPQSMIVVPSSSCWIAPPIPTISKTTDDAPPSTPLISRPLVITQPQKFATIGKASPAKAFPSQISQDIKANENKPTRTPPKPPVRRPNTSVITTLPTPKKSGSIQEPNSATNGTIVRQPQPRMGRNVMLSLRKTQQALSAPTAVPVSHKNKSTEQEKSEGFLEGDKTGDNDECDASVPTADPACKVEEFDFSAVDSAVTGRRKIRKSLSCFAPLPKSNITPSDQSKDALSVESPTNDHTTMVGEHKEETECDLECGISTDDDECCSGLPRDDQAVDDIKHLVEQDKRINKLNNQTQLDMIVKPQTFALTVKNELQYTDEVHKMQTIQETDWDALEHEEESVSTEADNSSNQLMVLEAEPSISQQIKPDEKSEMIEVEPHSQCAAVSMKMDPVGAVLTPPSRPRQTRASNSVDQTKDQITTAVLISSVLTPPSQLIATPPVVDLSQSTISAMETCADEENQVMMSESLEELYPNKTSHKRRSGEKRSLSAMTTSPDNAELYPATPSSTENTTEPSTKKRTVWVDEVEKSDEVFV